MLEAAGSTVGPGVTVHTRHRFTAGSIETSWRVVPHGGDHPYDVDVLFPTTGAHATVTAVLRDGRRVVLEPGANLALADVAWLRLAGDDGGYVVVVRSRALPGTLRLLRARPQSSAPRAGPTAGFALLSGGPLRELSACVRIAPARTTAEAQRVAAALGARA